MNGELHNMAIKSDNTELGLEQEVATAQPISGNITMKHSNDNGATFTPNGGMSVGPYIGFKMGEPSDDPKDYSWAVNTFGTSPMSTTSGPKVEDILTPTEVEEPVLTQPVHELEPLMVSKSEDTIIKTKSTEINQRGVGTLSDFMTNTKEAGSEEVKVELETERQVKNKLRDNKNIVNILDRAVVTDLNKIVLVDDDRSKKHEENFKFVLNTKPTYQVVLNQSAYIAHIESLRFADLFSITQSVSNNYEDVLRKYQTYYQKINSNSIGIKSFDEFCKFTSIYDVSTIQFGLFNITFPGETKFTINCGNCGETVKNVTVPNDYLILARNEEVYEQLDRVINSISSVTQSAEHSLVNKFTRLQLPISKSIVEIHIPTVADHLEILKQIREGKLIEASDYIDVLLFIKNMYLVDVIETEKAGSPVFIKCLNKTEILNVLKELEIDDAALLHHEIEGKDTKYRIEYAVHSFDCPKCKAPLGDIDVDVEDLLFQETLRKLGQVEANPK